MRNLVISKKVYDRKSVLPQVELKVKESISRLEQQLEAEKAARLKAEEMVETAKKNLDDKIRRLREDLESERVQWECRKQAVISGCAIL